jgi:hypothetical protein
VIFRGLILVAAAALLIMVGEYVQWFTRNTSTFSGESLATTMQMGEGVGLVIGLAGIAYVIAGVIAGASAQQKRAAADARAQAVAAAEARARSDPLAKPED